ncbi:uncharacterized protein LOC106073177 [Biomphalaria glabrata]|uniref:Uncharacterized protein LOC106073177 n=1 Tax=Biomphalaria glabrata TaxID=6526 RepID=A0A9W2YBY5_BIOGL|nr:uncharacterized protein LOC106073177 [Biomphalaria glabrata]
MEWSRCSVLFVACMIGILINGVSGAEEINEETINPAVISVVAVVGGVIGLVVIVIICAEKKVNPNVKRRGPPDWTNNLILKRELDEGFTDISDGIYANSPNHVTRERLGITVTDAARWNRGMTSGKHVFEINWPKKNNRGFSSCVGVGTSDVPMKKQGRVSLVGEHSQSWGLDMAKQRAIHFGKVQQRLYLPIPDRYFMYVDMDSGTVSFGDDVTIHGRNAEYYGNILTGIPKNSKKPFYLMISMCQPKEQVQVYYRGTATTGNGFNLIGGAPFYEDGGKGPTRPQEQQATVAVAPAANVINVYSMPSVPQGYPQQPAYPVQGGYPPPYSAYQPQGAYQQPGAYQQQGYGGYPPQGYPPAVAEGSHKKKSKGHKRSGSSSSSSSESDSGKKQRKELKKLAKLVSD